MAHRKLFENVYFIPGFTNVGVINAPSGKKNHIYLIDTGTDRHYAEEILKELCVIFPDGFSIRAVINTHGHSDHVGGNAFLQATHSAEVWISKKETKITDDTFSNVNHIWGGKAIPELKMWYSLKENFKPTRIINKDDKITLEDDSEISFVDLSGHSAEQLGILYKSRDKKSVFFTGDSYLGLDELFKAKISFQEEPLTSLFTMKKLLDMNADFFVQSHGLVPGTKDEVKETITGNIRTLEKLIAYINYALDKKNLTTEALVAKTIIKFKIHSRSVNFSLVHSTVKSLLSELYEQKKIGTKVKDGFFYWTKR